MNDQRRFALYFSPEDDSALAAFGRNWLGRTLDCTELAPLSADHFPVGFQGDLIKDARKYGFHATLKAPFRLKEGVSQDIISARAKAFASQQPSFVEPPFVLASLHGFLALRPAAASEAIRALADNCVRFFDEFRAPLNESERLKRLSEPLSEQQKKHLEQWGYPYVFENFRFHMTLTRKLNDLELPVVRSFIEKQAAQIRAEPTRFSSLCLFTQSEPQAPFVLKDRFAFHD